MGGAEHRGERRHDGPADRGRALRPGHGRADGAAAQAGLTRRRGGSSAASTRRCRRVPCSGSSTCWWSSVAGVVDPEVTDYYDVAPAAQVAHAGGLPGADRRGGVRRRRGVRDARGDRVLRRGERSSTRSPLRSGLRARTRTAPDRHPADVAARPDLADRPGRGGRAAPRLRRDAVGAAGGARGPRSDARAAGPSLGGAHRWPSTV